MTKRGAWSFGKLKATAHRDQTVAQCLHSLPRARSSGWEMLTEHTAISRSSGSWPRPAHRNELSERNETSNQVHVAFASIARLLAPFHISQGIGVCETGSIWGSEIPTPANRWGAHALFRDLSAKSNFVVNFVCGRFWRSNTDNHATHAGLACLPICLPFLLEFLKYLANLTKRSATRRNSSTLSAQLSNCANLTFKKGECTKYPEK